MSPGGLVGPVRLGEGEGLVVKNRPVVPILHIGSLHQLRSRAPLKAEQGRPRFHPIRLVVKGVGRQGNPSPLFLWIGVAPINVGPRRPQSTPTEPQMLVVGGVVAGMAHSRNGDMMVLFSRMLPHQR